MRMEAEKAWKARAVLCIGEPMEWGSQKNAHAYTWTFIFWSRQQDLNLRPTHYECAALPAELYRH